MHWQITTPAPLSISPFSPSIRHFWEIVSHEIELSEPYQIFLTNLLGTKHQVEPPVLPPCGVIRAASLYPYSDLHPHDEAGVEIFMFDGRPLKLYL